MEENTLKSAVLVSVCASGSETDECERSLDELERLLHTAGAEVYARVIQIKKTYDPRTVIGSGKVMEIRELCEAGGVDLVVFDFELSPMQIRNLEDDIGCADVIDRSMLILDIFALHATSGEGKLQVELAQLKYTAPRLIGKGGSLSRQGGGIGTRGPGETQLESDRRHLRSKIAALEARLKEMEHNRSVMRAQRDRSRLPKIAVVGYTNAGKSTLLNRLTGADALAEDKLFATLDPTTRKLALPSGETALLTDTVGFIRKLPHHLIEAFKSTLDEVTYADMLLIVSDVTDPEVREHLEVTEGIISDLHADDKPRIYVYNKCDKLDGISYAVPRERTVLISAASGMGTDALLAMIEDILHESKRECKLLIPYSEQSVLSSLYDKATVLEVDYLDSGIVVRAILGNAERGMLAKYIREE
ncbi:MAG: GTPase HflX [Ruminococcaceae bacterium]|nr:GTPase HflX [Oscillospiraceae bacterium]